MAIIAVNFGEGEPLDFEMLVDVEKRSPKEWGVRILPAGFLIRLDGQIRHSVVGEHDWSSDEAVKAIDGLLKRW